MKNLTEKKKLTLTTISITLLLIIVMGISYAFFSYSRIGSSNNIIMAGKLFFVFDDGEFITLTNAQPMSGSSGIALSTNDSTCTFTITGNTQVGNSITYAIWAIPGDASSYDVLGENYANYTSKFLDNEIYTYITQTSGDLAFTGLTDSTVGSAISSLPTSFTGVPLPEGGKLLGYGTLIGTGSNITGVFAVKMWIDSSVVTVCDNGCTYTSSEFAHKYYTMKIAVTSVDGSYMLGESNVDLSPEIVPGNITSLDNNLEIVRPSSENLNVTTFNNQTVWQNIIEDDNTSPKGNSRLTIKVDSDFVDNEHAYYDIILEYYDDSNAQVLLQVSQDANNTIDYANTGYGCYVEEAWCHWHTDELITRNIVYGMNNTNSWQTKTFRVNDAFFEENVDNYIHLYFGLPTNSQNKNIKIRKVKVVKHTVLVESIDQNNANNVAMVGNIYKNNNYGMGFSVKNVDSEEKTVNISYTIVDNHGVTQASNSLGNRTINANSEEKIYIANVSKYGTYELHVTLNHDNMTTEEVIKFSKVVDVNNKKNTFIGTNVILTNNGWVNDKEIDDNITLLAVSGMDNIRYTLGGSELAEDASWINSTNPLGRYTNTYGKFLGANLKVLTVNKNIDLSGISSSNLENYQITIGANTINGQRFTQTAFNTIKARAVSDYSKVANADKNKYGNKIKYYEIFNEWNFDSPYNGISAEQYAELVYAISVAIKDINPNAKIVAMVSSDDIWASTHASSYYSPSENHTSFVESSWMARVLATSFDNKELLHYVDCVSLHIYSYNESQSPSENYFEERVNGVRKLIEHYNTEGKIVPIIISETGYNSQTNNSELYAANLIKTYAWGQSKTTVPSSIDCSNQSTCHSYIEKIYSFSFQDDATIVNVAGGILDYQIRSATNTQNYERDISLAAKDAFVAVTMYNSLLADVEYLNSNITNNSTTYTFHDANANRNITVVWGNNTNVNVGVSSGDAKVYDMYGNEVESTITGNYISVQATNYPKYVVD